ncbi:SLC13 family permease [Salinicoccus carnicancri]|uniref:SLC13 family permease n=1 Tax=Salinicoccus carnicancri TaxID=558170 RepID=UPI0002FC3ABF|nr:SLC13 family permease [Salinicoccus carnicancri]
MSVKNIILSGLFTGFSITVFLAGDLGYSGKLSLVIFSLSLGMFIFSSIPAGLVAWLALSAGVLFGLPQDILFTSFSRHIVWLMIGAFIIAAVLEKSGLLERLIRWVRRNCYSKGRITLFTFVLVQILSVIIPSTSGRASALLPVYRAFSRQFGGSRKFFGLAVPVLILMGANLTLIGAGSHVIGIGILEGQTGQKINYMEFLVYGLPFGLLIGGISLHLLSKWYLEDTEFPTVEKEETGKKPFSSREKKASWLIGITLVLWLTEALHGFDIAFVTMLMAMIMMLPQMDLIGWKAGMKSVSWSLIFFVAGATQLGELLVTYKVTDFFQDRFLSLFDTLDASDEFLMLMLIILISVTSHLYITSHTTRAVVFIPVLLIFSEMFGLNPAAVVFISLIGINYCVTLPVSSKALLIFYEEDDRPFETHDLVKISLLLMPIYIALMTAMYYVFWQHAGLALMD